MNSIGRFAKNILDITYGKGSCRYLFNDEAFGDKEITLKWLFRK